MYKEIDLDLIEQEYQINYDGRIYYKKTGEEVHYQQDNKGYLKVYLKGIGCYFVHRLICLKYKPISNAAEMQVNHIDGNKSNNHIDNLEWVTNAENMAHAVMTGLRAHLNYKGECNASAKITEEIAMQIIQDLLEHKPMSQISKEYGISKSTISAIKNKRLWAHLTANIQFDVDYKRNSRSKLTPQQVDGIIKLLLQGLTYQEISNIFNCPKTVIQDIKLKRTWKQKTQNINFN